MTDHYRQIYTHRAADYHRLIESEDAADNLKQAIALLAPAADKHVLDLGTGTGRIPLLLGDAPARLIGLDLHAGMLAENARQREQAAGWWRLTQGDIRRLPLCSGWAHITLVGWAMGHFVRWYGPNWPTEIDRALREIHRLTCTGGHILIIETLTTGSRTPRPPHEGLAQYYHRLESQWGFRRSQIQTDYIFSSIDEAIATVEFFFGPALSATIRQEGWACLPEWTGIWHKTVANGR